MSDNMVSMPIPNSSFQFSAIAPEMLENSEYTLFTMIRDKSGSVSPLAQALADMENTAIDALKLSPRAENLLVRSESFNEVVTEEYGFKPMIDVAHIPAAHCTGGTALRDAVYAGIGATLQYADTLRGHAFGSEQINAILIIITDGDDTSSAISAARIKKVLEEAIQNEKISSITTILVGINDQHCKTYLQQFKDEAGLDQFVSMGDATPSKIAKLCGFISKSVSMKSQSLGNPAVPSQPVNLTF
jgi:hypothetical protein